MKIQVIPKSLDLLIQNLLGAIAADGNLTPLRAAEVVASTAVKVEDLMHYADFDHPIEDCYGRKLVFDNGNFEVMVMSWNPDHYSSIHNHGNTQWGVVQVFGEAHHMIFHEKDNELRLSKKEICTTGSVVKVNNKFVHQMGNASTSPYLSLHVYGCNDRTEGITDDAKNYDLEYDRISHTTGGAFFNLPKDAIYDFEELPYPTDEVFLHYSYLLLSHYNRQPETEKIKMLKKNLMTKLQRRMLSKDMVLPDLKANLDTQLN